MLSETLTHNPFEAIACRRSSDIFFTHNNAQTRTSALAATCKYGITRVRRFDRVSEYVAVFVLG